MIALPEDNAFALVTPSQFDVEHVRNIDDFRITSAELRLVIDSKIEHNAIRTRIEAEFDEDERPESRILTVGPSNALQEVDGYVLDRFQFLRFFMRMRGEQGKRFRRDAVLYIRALEAKVAEQAAQLKSARALVRNIDSLYRTGMLPSMAHYEVIQRFGPGSGKVSKEQLTNFVELLLTQAYGFGLQDAAAVPHAQTWEWTAKLLSQAVRAQAEHLGLDTSKEPDGTDADEAIEQPRSLWAERMGCYRPPKKAKAKAY